MGEARSGTEHSRLVSPCGRAARSGRGGRAPPPESSSPPPWRNGPRPNGWTPRIGRSNARRARPQSGARVAVKSNYCLHLLLLLSRCGGQRFNRRYSCPKPCRLRMVWKPPYAEASTRTLLSESLSYQFRWSVSFEVSLGGRAWSEMLGVPPSPNRYE